MRVVSLLPAGTEMVAALGALENLVGITHACDFPAVVSSRMRVTTSKVDAGEDSRSIDLHVRERVQSGESLFALNGKKIAALHPELILTQALCDVCAVNERDVQALVATLTPAPRVVTLGGQTLDGVLEDIAKVSDALGTSDECEELLAGFRARLRAVHGALQEAQAPRPRVALIEWTDPVYAAGHWAPEMLHRAGGADVLMQPGVASRVVGVESIAAAKPDIVIVAPCGYNLTRAVTAAKALRGRPKWRWLGDRQLWAVDANALVSRPGPRLIDGIEVFARILHPTLFSALDEYHAQRV